MEAKVFETSYRLKGLTIDSKLLKEIENLRGREKRSTFIEHLIRLGLKAYNAESKPHTF
jgi:metal-responsive CopG/Arc/MetJ family transcriptional regulator